MATNRSIQFTFDNQFNYDLATDGVLHKWGDDGSGKFCTNPVTVPAYSTGVAFKACGNSDAATGVRGAVNYWLISRNGSLSSTPTVSNTYGSIQLYFSVPYTGANSWSHHLNVSKATMTFSGWSSSPENVAVLMNFTPTN